MKDAVELESPGSLANNAFERELETLINRHCKEKESNTPDFILAQYLAGCLVTFNTAVRQRENWYGRVPGPTSPR